MSTFIDHNVIADLIKRATWKHGDPIPDHPETFTWTGDVKEPRAIFVIASYPIPGDTSFRGAAGTVTAWNPGPTMHL